MTGDRRSESKFVRLLQDDVTEEVALIQKYMNIKETNMKGTFTRTIAMACVAVLCCSVMALAQDVRYNFAPGTDFSKYKTYKWVQVEGGSHTDQIVDDQIKQAIDSQLAPKGLTKTTEDKADLYVAYQVAVQQERQWNAYNTGGVRFGGMGTGTATSSTINIGTLVLDFYDVAE
jgi:hypothetical protein